MPAGPSLDVRRFRRAAQQRLKEARVLLNSHFTTAAVYLAGYAVECGLKALLLSNEPSRRNRETIKQFRGSRAHNFDWLQMELQRRKVPLPLPVLRQLSKLGWWTTDLRYDPSQIEEHEASQFLTVTAEIVDWVQGRL